MEKKIIAAIDVGSTKIASIIGEKIGNNKFNILQFAINPSKGIERGNVENVQETTAAIKQTIEKMSGNSALPTNSVYIGIAGEHITTKFNSKEIMFHEEHEVSEKDIKHIEEALHYTQSNADEELISLLPIAYTIDGQKEVYDPIGIICKYSINANYLMIFAKKSRVNSLKQCINYVNLQTEALFLEPLASLEAVLMPEEKRGCVAMIDIGGGTSDFAVCENGKIVYTAVIPLGGNNITKLIAQKFSIQNSYAETIKHKVGISVNDSFIFRNEDTRNSFSAKDVGTIIKEKYEEILISVLFQLRTIGYDKKITKLILTGGASQVPNLRQLAAFCMKCEIRIATPIDKIEGLFKSELGNPKFSTAVGLLILGNKHEIALEKEKAEELSKTIDIEVVQEPNLFQNSEQNQKEEEIKTKKRFGFKNIKNILGAVVNTVIDDDDENKDKNTNK